MARFTIETLATGSCRTKNDQSLAHYVLLYNVGRVHYMLQYVLLFIRWGQPQHPQNCAKTAINALDDTCLQSAHNLT